MYQDAGTARSGCNDAFSVFGFLAFLLALIDLIMDMQVSLYATLNLHAVFPFSRLIIKE